MSHLLSIVGSFDNCIGKLLLAAVLGGIIGGKGNGGEGQPGCGHTSWYA